MKSEWTKVSLLSVCSRLSSGKSISSKLLKEKGVIPVYGGNGVRGYIEEGENFNGECAIIGRQGAYCGNVRFFSGKAYMTEHAIVAQANACADTRFLAYKLSLMQLGRLSGQSAQPGLSVKVLGEQVIDIPPLPIQRKIASILSALDDKIETNNAICRNLEEQIKLIFKDTYASKVKDSSARIEDVTLADVCSEITKGTTPSTLGYRFENVGVNFVKAESITNSHRIENNKISFISLETHNKLKRSQVEDGDILFSIAGTLGRFTIADTHILPANTNQAVAIIRANKEKVAPEYLYSLFIAGWHEEYCKKNVQQAVQANLSLGIIKSLPIFLLLGQEMKNYLSKITPLITTMKKLERESSSLAYLRDALLPKLMSGELEVETLV